MAEGPFRPDNGLRQYFGNWIDCPLFAINDPPGALVAARHGTWIYAVLTAPQVLVQALIYEDPSMTRKNTNWFGLGLEAWSLALDASAVMALRAMRIAAGGAQANRELAAMITEKVASGFALQTMMLTNRLGATPQAAAAKTLAHFRPKVHANRRRLTKKHKR